MLKSFLAVNVDAQNHAKHIAELTNLIASKQRTKSMSSAFQPNIQLPPLSPRDASTQEAKESPRSKAQSMIAIPGLGQKIRPPVPPREKSMVSQNPLSVGQLIPDPTIPSKEELPAAEPSTLEETPSIVSESLTELKTQPTAELITEEQGKALTFSVVRYSFFFFFFNFLCNSRKIGQDKYENPVLRDLVLYHPSSLINLFFDFRGNNGAHCRSRCTLFFR
jgi:hypothetical protein